MYEINEYDVCVMYRQAKDKKEQLKILAQLNDVRKKDIVEILKRHGYKPVFKEEKNPIRRRVVWTPERVDRLVGLKDKGLCHFEIEDIMKLPPRSAISKLARLKRAGEL